MGSSLAFHIVFASLDMDLPLMLIAEGLYLRSGDRVWLGFAPRSSKEAGVLSRWATIISVELPLPQ